MPIQPANGMPQRLPGEIKPYCAQALPRKKKRVQPCATTDIEYKSAGGWLRWFPPEF
jgi:hypothetical protein